MVPIHYAVLRNNYEMVRFLLEHKADEIAVGKYKKEISQNQEKQKNK